MNTPTQAVAFAKQLSITGSTEYHEHCLGFVRTAYGSAATGSNAAAQWAATKQRGTGVAPFGALVWWTGGQEGDGHVALSNGDGYVWSTDFGPNGYIGDGKVRLIPIASVAEYDSLQHYAGWSYDLDGTTVLEEDEVTADDIAKVREVAREMVCRGVRVLLIGNKDRDLDPTGALDTILQYSLASVYAHAATGNGVSQEQLAAELKKVLEAAAAAV